MICISVQTGYVMKKNVVATDVTRLLVRVHKLNHKRPKSLLLSLDQVHQAYHQAVWEALNKVLLNRDRWYSEIGDEDENESGGGP